MLVLDAWNRLIADEMSAVLATEIIIVTLVAVEIFLLYPSHETVL